MWNAGLLVVAAAAAGAPAAVGAGTPRIPILMYHRIGEPRPGAAGLDLELTCRRAVLRSHLAYLRSAGFSAVTFRAVEAALRTGAPLPGQPVILTFDDGLASHWDAFEDLRQAGMPGVFFVVSRALDREGRLSRSQVRAMAEAGMEIGSHSATHPDLRRATPSEREVEIAGSKRELEALVGGRVLSFAYPGGAYDEDCFPLLARAGYLFARTTVPGIAAVSVPGFELEAVPIWRGTDARRLAGKLGRLRARTGLR